MNKLKDLLIEIDEGINKLQQEFDDNLYDEVSKKLLELDNLINTNQVPKEIYVQLVKFHHEKRLIHASLKNMNKKGK